jgi:cbb3-type cytochrome oxidase cytochrome c subunit
MAPPPPPPTRPDRHYNFRAMNVVFAVSSLALLAVTLWMVFDDYAKPWKRIQARFRGLERQKLAADEAAERGKLDQAAIAAAQKDVADQEERLAQRQGDVDSQEKALADWKAEVYRADSAWRETKSLLDTARYQYEEALQGGDADKVAARRQEVAELQERFRGNLKALEENRKQRDAVTAKLAELHAALDADQGRLKELRGGLTALQTRMASLDKGFDYFVLNAPLFDFLEPSLKIEQVILSGLYTDINFTTVPRVDRCMTCHVASNRAGFEADQTAANGEPAWPRPYQTHPRLDLFVGDTSPHPYSRFGCTICHAGLDRGTDFARAGHSPASEEERERWAKRWGWERQKFLDHPVLPEGTAEAGCISCHAGEIWTPGSEVQDVGRKLITRMGCYGCHVIDLPAYTGLRRTGPDLTSIAVKTRPEWAYKWIEAPRKFRPTTWMPHFFYLENVKGKTNLERQKAEIASLVAFLWDKSERRDYPAPPAGNAARGKALFESVGCTGCHILDPNAKRDDFYPVFNRLHGPNLARTGSKVGAGWLYAWLKNPKAYFPDTNMPNLRLSDQEAGDLVAYLMAQRDPAYENLQLPAADPAVRDDLVRGYLLANYTIEASEQRLEAMSDHERNVFLGQQTVSKYGCYGCHLISGFEDTKPIGTELTQEGSKPLHQLDFGHVAEVPDTRHDWIYNKLLDPRIWDRGREEVKDYNELFKMPDFGMSEREARAVLTNILGFTKESVRPERKAGLGPEVPALAAGRKLITRYNCQGCHLIEGQGQAIRQVMDRTLLPPNLAAEGARVQSDWLFSFLHDPGQVRLRPWLTARMPTFGFSDEQVNTLISYFGARDHRETFQSAMTPSDGRSLAVGQAVFTMLQCARCHPAGAEAAAATGRASPAELAPSLLLARQRLRWDWVPRWIEDPQSWITGTNMPSNFEKTSDGKYRSPLEYAYDAPMFAPYKRELMQRFDSEEELKAYLFDVDKVTTALRDHIWTLR